MKKKFSTSSDGDLTILGMGCFTFILFFVLAATVATKMFEYSFFVFFGRDIPWYCDLAGGLVLNGVNFPIWVLSLIISHTIETPVFVL